MVTDQQERLWFLRLKRRDVYSIASVPAASEIEARHMAAKLGWIVVECGPMEDDKEWMCPRL